VASFYSLLVAVFKKKSVFEEEATDGGGWGSGTWFGETRAEKRPRGLWRSSASQEEREQRKREREKERRGEERREGSFFSSVE
jgi:hypothetical protein